MFDTIAKLPAIPTVNIAANIFGAFQQASAGRRAARSYADAAVQDQAAAADRAAQVGRRATEQLGTRAMQAARELGRINAVLSDTGLVGNTAMRLRQEVAMAAARDTRIIQDNADAEIRQTQRYIRSIGAQYESEINAIKRPSVFQQTLTAAGLFLDPKMGEGPTFVDIFRQIK